jgi:hypothetical protein
MEYNIREIIGNKNLFDTAQGLGGISALSFVHYYDMISPTKA